MDTVRFFKDRAKANLRALRDAGDSGIGLQQVQHQVAVAAGYRSWSALLVAPERDRRLAAAMVEEPRLNANGMGPGAYSGTLQERRDRFDRWRTELRSRADHVEKVRAWLVENVDPRKTVNPAAGSYSLKHIAEELLGEYVSNGELIAAAIIAGYPYRREGGSSPNVSFGMTAGSLKAARQAAQWTRERR